MALVKFLLALFLAVMAVALPPARDLAVSSVSGTATPDLESRQLLTAGTTISCCENCDAGYSYDELWHIFDDVCAWLGSGQTLWSNGAYDTQDYYCRASWNENICVWLRIEYHCGGEHEAPIAPDNPAGARHVDYAGCMGYFEDVIQPGTCGGPTYSGAQVISGNQCWIFKVVSEKSPFSKRVIATPADGGDEVDDSGLDCAPGARLCPISTDSNGTALGGMASIAAFGEPVERMS